MAWPQPTDYHEAVQNPASCFKDGLLRSGTPLLDQLGLPRAILGNFASVYQIRNGSKKHAVRCFLTYHRDQERRYAAISAELARLRLPFMVDFLFEREGILVKGKWYPMLRMDWVEGTPLTTHIEASLSSPPKLLRLADRFLSAVGDLQKNGLAHGDLQHGNVLVLHDDSIKFIDYDGMYVPALRGMGSHELGHPNYQHPGRDEFKAFGPGMDNFSTWVITISLLTLCFDPFLWSQVNGGDERLLFAKTDFRDPVGSEILTTMRNSPHPKIVEMGQQVHSLLTLPADKVPPVDGNILSGVDVPTSAAISLDPLEDIVIDTTPGGGAADVTGAVSADWVLDHLGPPAAIRLTGSLLLARLMVMLWFVAMSFVGWASYTGPLAADVAGVIGSGALLALSLVLVADFRRREERRERGKRKGALRDVKRQLRRFERQLKDANKRKKSVQEQEKKELQDFAILIGAVATREQEAVDRVVEETQRLVSRKQQDRADTVRKEQQSLAAGLKRIQDAYVDQALRAIYIHSSSVSGIGEVLKRRLAAAGARTAADLHDWQRTYVYAGYRGYSKEVAELNIGGSWYRIEGIGPIKAASLMEWRNSRAAIARARAPKQLTQSQRDQIVQQYQAQRTSIDRHIALAQQQQQQQIATIQQNANTERQGLERQVGVVKSKYATQYPRMNTEIHRRSLEVATVKWRVSSAERSVAEYRRITARHYTAALFGRR